MCFGGMLSANTTKTRTFPQSWLQHAVVLASNGTESWHRVSPQRDMMNFMQNCLKLIVIVLTNFYSVPKSHNCAVHVVMFTVIIFTAKK